MGGREREREGVGGREREREGEREREREKRERERERERERGEREREGGGERGVGWWDECECQQFQKEFKVSFSYCTKEGKKSAVANIVGRETALTWPKYWHQGKSNFK